LEKKLKGPKMLTTSAENVGFAPTHSEKCGFLPKYMFHLSSQEVHPIAHGI
jgi:hypothetical protein